MTSRRNFVGGLAASSALVATGVLRRRARRAPGNVSRSEVVEQPSARDALVDALLPASTAMPGALEVGAAAHLDRALDDSRFEGVRRLIGEGVERLDSLARQRHGHGLSDIAATARIALLEDALAHDTSFAWTRFRDALVDFVLEGYLGHPARGGNRDARVWARIALPLAARSTGSTSELFEAARTRIGAEPLAAAARERWDAIVVGSGAGGGVAAWRLTMAGWRVLVLEKGPRLPARALVPDEVGSCLRDAFVPFVAEDPHVMVEDGEPRRSFDGWTSSCVGGGTVHMSAMLYRMHPEDFEARARFGAPAGSTLADWPIRYGDLRPYYDRIQEQLGLSGQTGSNPFEPAGAPYPQAPLPAHPAAPAIDRAAAAAGRHAFPTPRGILTAEHQGRRACIQCGYCGAYACPVGAKASTTDTFLSVAESTARCHVLAGAAVMRITENGLGRAVGVIVRDGNGADHELRAPTIVLAASAVETARLLLLSDSARHPHGLGNGAGQVGKNLVFSLEAAGRAVFPYPSAIFPREHDALPFINRSFQDRYVDRDAPGPYPKVGTLVLERAHFNPIQRARRAAREDPAVLGAALSQRLDSALRERREIVYESFVEMLPREGTSVGLDPSVTGVGGVPVARIELGDFPGEAGRAARIASLAREMLEPLGPTAIHADTALRRTTFLQAGTCRMGRDKSTSVTDTFGRVHGVAGLVIVDGSVLPTMGGVPPTLTIMANALRIAERVVARDA